MSWSNISSVIPLGWSKLDVSAGLPDPAERRKILAHAGSLLVEAQLLLDRLDAREEKPRVTTLGKEIGEHAAKVLSFEKVCPLNSGDSSWIPLG